jgi:hypothetical protein
MSLTAERARELFSYDPETGIVTYAQGRRAGQQCGRARSDGYLATKVFNKTVYIHRLAWLIVHGRWPEHRADHINRQRADNRIANLREASGSGNSSNRVPINKSTGFRGVTNMPRNRFQAHVWLNSKRHRGPCRADPVSAAADYDELARKLHGEFAVTNADLGLLPRSPTPTNGGAE